MKVRLLRDVAGKAKAVNSICVLPYSNSKCFPHHTQHQRSKSTYFVSNAYKAEHFSRYSLHSKTQRFCLSTTSTTTATSSQNDETKNVNGFSYPTKLDSQFLARQFIDTLTNEERSVLREELVNIEEEKAGTSTTGTNGTTVERPTGGQLFSVCLQNGLPFIGFGFIDNFLMITAGDLIEIYIGMFLPLSTMAAAGLGNGVSDVFGIGMAHHIEYYCSKLMNQPRLTPQQWSLPIVTWSMVISKSLCIFVGCLIGMFPLLFIKHDSTTTASKKTDNETEEKTASSNS